MAKTLYKMLRHFIKENIHKIPIGGRFFGEPIGIILIFFLNPALL
jgi:hypothetical protein